MPSPRDPAARNLRCPRAIAAMQYPVRNVIGEVVLEPFGGVFQLAIQEYEVGRFIE